MLDAEDVQALGGDAELEQQEGGNDKHENDDDVTEQDDEDEDDDEEDEGPGDLSAEGRVASRKAIGFAVDIDHTEALAAMFAAAGVSSTCVHSRMPVDQARQRLLDFRHGSYDVLWNCEQLTEGFDEPSLSALLLARPTKSTGLYTQPDCLVLDFTDRAHKVTQVVDVRVLLDRSSWTDLKPFWQQQEAPPDKTRQIDPLRAPEGTINVLEDPINPQQLAWIKLGPHWVVNIFDGGNIWLVNISAMGHQQQQRLGLVPRAAAAPVQGKRGCHEEELEGLSDLDDEIDFSDDDNDDDNDDARFVVLHQPSSADADPFHWVNVTRLAGQGMSESDAYGAAAAFIVQDARERAVRHVKALKSKRWHFRTFRPSHMVAVGTFRKDARWRDQPVSGKQLDKLGDLGGEWASHTGSETSELAHVRTKHPHSVLLSAGPLLLKPWLAFGVMP
eukprot:gene13362-13489_t